MVKDDATGNFEKLEFWAIAILFVFNLPSLISPYPPEYFTAGELVRYVGFFLIFLYFNFRLAPKVLSREYPVKTIFLTILVFVAMLVVNIVAEVIIHQRGFGFAIREGFLHALLAIMLFAGYVTVKQILLYMVSKSDDIQAFFIIFNRHSLIVAALWILLAYCMLMINIPIELWFGWLTIVPTGIILHGLAFNYFIPGSLKTKRPLMAYFVRIVVFCFVTGFLISIPILIATGEEDDGFVVGLINGVIHFILTAPALWLIYRWQMRGKEQINALQSELGRSSANVDFLRSQINPHFLFNALNTMYGLAIHEKAERTSEAIQKLGEMMRFMLNENTQERISLQREIEYLENYISLQRLRTDSNSNLKIQVDIMGEVNPATRITPMLLIPFVENAFKHGISLREESYIKISLELKDKTLYFDVLNSRHQKTDNDPEKDSNGIGLANVRYRLLHVYPGKHELMVRETGRDFFVHLRLELD